jgi:hypothetical protein
MSMHALFAARVPTELHTTKILYWLTQTQLHTVCRWSISSSEPTASVDCAALTDCWCRLELELDEAGALHVLQEQQQQQQQQPSPINSTSPHPQAAGPSSSSTQQSYVGLEGFQPQWLLLEGNEWRKRVQVTQRFVNAVRVVMYRNRAQARLQKLKLLAGVACCNVRSSTAGCQPTCQSLHHVDL